MTGGKLTGTSTATAQTLRRRGLALEYTTLSWNVVGTVVAITAALSAGSVALAGFGLALMRVYTATINDVQEHGTATGSIARQLGESSVEFTEQFDSTGAVQLTSKDQCKKGGWQSFGFRNQGDCVSFVATGGQNPPAPRPSR